MVQFGRMLSAERPCFYSICSGRRKSIYFDFYAEHKEDFSEYEAQVSMIFYYSDLLENKYSVVLNLVFRIAKDGEVDITDYHVSIPSRIKESNNV